MKKLEINKKNLINFLKGYPWASCYEINFYFKHKENEWTRIETKNFSIIVPLEEKIVDKLIKIGVEMKVNRGMMALMVGDGEVWKQPKESWYLHNGRKISFRNKLTSVNFK